MQAYKFETMVLKGGVFKLPQLKELENHRVEIIIIDEGEAQAAEKEMSAKKFLDKWSGVLGEETEEDEKLKYLENKYK